MVNVPKKKQKFLMVKKMKKRNKQKPRRNTSRMFESLGSLAGGVFGSTGERIGRNAGRLISRITGMGDYKVQGNSLLNTATIPTFRQMSDGVEICHREFITDITGSTLFNVIALSINPGLNTTFPWLSSIAQNFEQYEMRGLIFEYRPSSGSAVSSTSSALGVVVYATDYNSLSPNFTTKQEMESYEYSSSTAPFSQMLHPIECAPKLNTISTYFIRNTSVPNNADIRLYDMGTFQYATQGMQSAYNVGELWVSYHVVFKKPRILPNSPYMYCHITESPTASAASAHALGTSGGQISDKSNLTGITLIDNSTFRIANAGRYFIQVLCHGTVNITSNVTLSLGSHITIAPTYYLDSVVTTAYLTSTTYAHMSCYLYVSTTSQTSNNNVAITGATAFTGGSIDITILPSPEQVD